ncbi:MAG: site-specific DNA-methyltransferase [Candidatus Heimdallarchaeum aukensis]|uniref:Site-specific DNA-methyltransferase n=1 Tax=Candidatus Heimdallarchaeum aukensis TaxID=2876573 RepID=A0A9Y1BKC0_9ARCH|nr:MAG: site-specific DNA-methyltransferase [Candidatus Heimdallarchaeum aukensis]
MNTKEEQFFKQLKDIFCGARVEGDSGFINLMRIKSSYFNALFNELKKEINIKIANEPSFKEELFDKLYTFFKTYFSDTGSVYFNYTPLKSKVYEKVYTNNEDTMLFWKTHMLHYVKTARIWNNLKISLEINNKDYIFLFDISDLNKQDSAEKNDVIYILDSITDNIVKFNVVYSKRGKTTKLTEIVKKLYKNNIPIGVDQLSGLFMIFEKQNEVDYFINKNANMFLKEQFNMWLKQYVLDVDSIFNRRRLNQLKILHDIAYKIIDFISQFEDELVKIWNKPRFVINSNYIITLDKIYNSDAGAEILEKIINHEKFTEQINEWKKLGFLEDFEKNKLYNTTLMGKELNDEYKFLPLDTKFFDEELKFSIISLFNNLDESLDGWLIHSENYQALKTILPKFNNKIKSIYIDPPYNTGSDSFIYKDKFKHSSWLTMMCDRLELAKELLCDDGVLYSSIDDNEVDYLSILLQKIFGENKVDKMIWKKASEGRWGKMKNVRTFRKDHEYVLVAFKEKEQLNKIIEKPRFLKRYGNPDSDPRGNWMSGTISRKESASNPNHPNFYTVTSPSGKKFTRQWDVPKEEFDKLNREKRIYWGPTGENVPRIKVFENEYREITPYSVLIDKGSNTEAKEEFINILGKEYEKIVHILNPKPSKLISTLLQLSTNKDSIIVDFFAGSGTTAHAIMALNKKDNGNRKFLLVEMAEYFEDIILPRIKKLAFSLNWKKGKPEDYDGNGIFIKYFQLEQYEQTLQKVVYREGDPFLDIESSDIYCQYIFLKDQKLLDAIDINYEENRIKVDFSKLYSNVDIGETLSYLLGKKIKRVDSSYVIFTDGEQINYYSLDFKVIKPLIWW